jgi:branched-chain amino acid transport system ATP-binding protein
VSERDAAATDTRAIQITDLSVQFGGLNALSEINLTCWVGEVVGVVGPNGAGKTTLLNAISRTVLPTSGRIELFGQETSGMRSTQIARLGVGRSFQLAELFSQMTVEQYILLGLHNQMKGRAVPIAIGRGRREERAAWERARAELAAYGLGAISGGATMGSLSYGTRKRLDIVRASIANPRLLLLDEPSSGLSEAESSELAELWRERRKSGQDQAATVIVVDHRVGFVRAFCERLVAISYGRKIADGDCDSVLGMPAVQEAFMGRALSQDS